jgi:hypothetical protein
VCESGLDVEEQILASVFRKSSGLRESLLLLAVVVAEEGSNWHLSKREALRRETGVRSLSSPRRRGGANNEAQGLLNGEEEVILLFTSITHTEERERKTGEEKNHKRSCEGGGGGFASQENKEKRLNKFSNGKKQLSLVGAFLLEFFKSAS